VQLHAEAIVDDDGAGFGIFVYRLVFWVQVLGVGACRDDGGSRGEAVGLGKGFLHKGIHHVACTPDAETDADVGFFAGREGVAAFRVGYIVYDLL